MQYFAHRHPRPEDHPNQPDLDFRDLINEYLVEVEVPGIKSPEEVKVTWTGHRTLLLSGNTARPKYGAPENARAQEDQPEQHPGGVHLLVGERRIGPFRRYINFPTEVDNIAVTLEAGLLRITAEKKGYSEVSARKVEVKHE